MWLLARAGVCVRADLPRCGKRCNAAGVRCCAWPQCAEPRHVSGVARLWAPLAVDLSHQMHPSPTRASLQANRSTVCDMRALPTLSAGRAAEAGPKAGKAGCRDLAAPGAGSRATTAASQIASGKQSRCGTANWREIARSAACSLTVTYVAAPARSADAQPGSPPCRGRLHTCISYTSDFASPHARVRTGPQRLLWHGLLSPRRSSGAFLPKPGPLHQNGRMARCGGRFGVCCRLRRAPGVMLVVALLLLSMCAS